ncbi:hypothetical protein ACWA5Z_09725 [Testudinibacter sp. P80/BLE/0925]
MLAVTDFSVVEGVIKLDSANTPAAKKEEIKIASEDFLSKLTGFVLE